MKQIITFMVLSFFFSKAYTQSIVVSENPVNVATTVDMSTVEAATDITNNTASAVTLRWRVTLKNLASGWTSTVCDKNNCYSSSTLTKDFTMAPNETSYLKVNFNFGPNTGSGDVKIVVFDITDSLNTVQEILYHADITVGIKESYNNVNLKVFPNPAQNILYIEVDPSYAAKTIQIFDMVGAKVKTIPFLHNFGYNSIDVLDLRNGMYLLRVLDENNQIIKATNFTKN